MTLRIDCSRSSWEFRSGFFRIVVIFFVTFVLLLYIWWGWTRQSDRRIMVELSGKDDPFQHGFPNVVFILPAIVVAGLSGKLRKKYSHRIETYAHIHISIMQCGNLINVFKCRRNLVYLTICSKKISKNCIWIAFHYQATTVDFIDMKMYYRDRSGLLFE